MTNLDNSFGFLIDILNSLFKPLDKRPSGMNVLGGLFFFVIVLWVRGCDSLLLIFPSIFRLLSHDPLLCCLVYFFNSVGFRENT